MAILLVKNGDTCVRTGDVVGVFPDNHKFSHRERLSEWGGDPSQFLPIFVLVHVVGSTVEELEYLLSPNPNAVDAEGVEIPGVPVHRYWLETPAEGTPERVSLQENYEIEIDHTTLLAFLRDRA